MVASMVFIPKILVVSNLQTTSPLWAFNVTQQRLRVILETDPANAIQRWSETLPDMVVFDIDSESLALELITKLREEAVLPILLLTSIRSDKFMLEAYQAGLDEYVLKPVHPSLFDAKIKAGWQRAGDIHVHHPHRRERGALEPGQPDTEAEAEVAEHTEKSPTKQQSGRPGNGPPTLL